MHLPYQKYESGDYARDNPEWDTADSPWKAAQVASILERNQIRPGSVVEVGCGAGRVLSELEARFPTTEFKGFDIAGDARMFWEKYSSDRTSFEVADFAAVNTRRFDVLLMLDVLEHVPDPFAFLLGLREHADYFVFHIPLDLNSVSVLREKPLLYVRDKVGHIHYFTKGLALALLHECGYEVLDWRYTGAGAAAPQRGWKTRLASIPRTLACSVNKDLGVRLFGGETLIVLAKSVGKA
jgi:SAM-dependent methyltransferase